MIEVFVDTQHIVALVVPGDSYAQTARRYEDAPPGHLYVTTGFVLAEVLGYVCEMGARTRQAASTAVRRFQTSIDTVVIPASTELFDEALRLYEARPDKGYSLVDCTSMVIMRERGIEGVLTADRHFEQEGFRALLRS